MRNIWKTLFIILLCFVVVGTIASGISATNFHHGSGLRFWGSSAHLSIRQNCYFLEPSTHTIIGSGEFVADGYSFEGDFSGVVNIDKYPLEPEDMMQYSFHRINKNLVFLTGTGTELTAGTLNKEWTRFYHVSFVRQNFNSKPQAIVIEIIQNNKPLILAVCAQSEDEAWEKYEIYRESSNK